MNKIETIKLNYEFKNVFKKGKYFVGNQVIIYFYKNNKRYNRLGIAISSKLCNAVERNHLKRLIREAYRKSELKNIKGYDIVFIWNKRCNYTRASYENILTDINNIISKNNF